MADYFVWFDRARKSLARLQEIRDTSIDSIAQEFISSKYTAFAEDAQYKEWYLKSAIHIQTMLANQRDLIIDDEKIATLNHQLIIFSKTFLIKNLELKDALFKLVKKLCYPHVIKITDEIYEDITFSILITLKEEIFLDSPSDNEISANYFRVSNALVSIFLLYLKQRLLKTNQFSELIRDQFKNLMENDHEKFSLASILVELLIKNNLVKMTLIRDTSEKGKLNPLRKIRHLTLTELAKSLLNKSTKIDFLFYEKLPLMHYAYPFIRNEKKTSLLGDGYEPATHSIKEGIIFFKNGCKLKFISKRVVDTLNGLIMTPVYFDYPLAYWYLQKFIDKNETVHLRSFSDYDNSLEIELRKYLPNPIEHENLKIRIRAYFNRLHFILTLVEAIAELSFIHKNKLSYDIIKLWLNIKNTSNTYKLLKCSLPLFFSKFLCLRGRSYDYSILGTSSGSEFERSLIRSTLRKMTIADLECLYNYIASIIGWKDGKNLTKLSWNEKIQIVGTNLSYFLDTKQIETAKKKFLFVSLLSEFASIGITAANLKEKLSQGIKTQICISLDSTSSGYQILSGLLGITDYKINLRAQNKDSPVDDIYQDIIRSINLRIKNLKTFPLSLHSIASQLPELTRDATKTLLMSYVYGMTFKKMKSKLIEFLEETKLKTELNEYLQAWLTLNPNYKILNIKKSVSKKIKRKDRQKPTTPSKILESNKRKAEKFNKLLVRVTSILRQTIENMVPSLITLYRTLRTYAQSTYNLNSTIVWSTLTGDLQIEQSYYEVKNKTYSLPRRKRITLPKISDKLDLRKGPRAFVANLIQSFDGNILRETIQETLKQRPSQRTVISTVHDNFFISIVDFEFFYKCFLSTFINIFRDENIQRFLNSLKTPEHIIKEYKKSVNFRPLIDKEQQWVNNLTKSYSDIRKLLTISKADRERFNSEVSKSMHIITF